MIQFECPQCGRKLSAKDDAAGRRTKCAQCGEMLKVPGGAFTAGASVPPPPPPRVALGESSATRGSPLRWVAFGCWMLVAFVLGAVGGVLVGVQKGRTDAEREPPPVPAPVKAPAGPTYQDLEALRNSLAAVTAERDRANEQLQVFIRERDARRAIEAAAAEEAARRAEAAKASRAARGNPRAVIFKDFVNFPEEYVGHCVRFNDVWLHGDFNRVEDSRDFSPSVSSKDGKYVGGRKLLKFADGVVFVMSEEIGRPLSVGLEADTKYGANLCCETSKVGKVYLARIYRVETRTVTGEVKDVFQEQ